MSGKPIPIGVLDFSRTDSEEPKITLQNRHFEQNPSNQSNQVGLLSRPGFKKWLNIGGSPVNSMYCQPGSFNNAMFAVSGPSLYRINTDETISVAASGVLNTSFGSNGRVCVKFASTSRIGSTPEYLWIVDGYSLWLYSDEAPAKAFLAAAANVSNGDTVNIGGVYYRWTTGSVNTGSPAGTSANPWLVKVGASINASLGALKAAINITGSEGVDYSTATTEHPDVYATFGNATGILSVYSKAFSATANNIATTIITGANLAWSASTMIGGGSPGTVQVIMPDDLSPIDVCFIAGYVLVVVAEGEGVNGRFYWINPGEVVVDALNFATAERTADPLYNCQVSEDQVWLFGTTTTEVWYPSSDYNTPFIRVDGRLLNTGIWPGTNVKLNDSIMFVSPEGGVFQIQGGANRVSGPSEEEAIRKSFASQKINGTLMRAWGCIIDGHSFYVLYLPGSKTLVYDLSTEKWTTWTSAGFSYLNHHVGFNWLVAGTTTYLRNTDSNVIVGDIRTGQLWIADPNLGYDENISTGDPEGFPCIVTGGIEVRQIESLVCNMVNLVCATGSPKINSASITLETSDDLGKTWVSHGSKTMTTTSTPRDFIWRSLGRFGAPGRLFRISDSGATIRIDSLDFM